MAIGGIRESMEVKKGTVEKLISSTLGQNRLEPDQIPELDLYVDQILIAAKKIRF